MKKHLLFLFFFLQVAYAQEIAVSDFDSLVVAEGYRVIVVSGPENKVITPQNKAGIPYRITDKTLEIGNRRLPDGVPKDYELIVHTQSPLRSVHVTTHADVFLQENSFYTERLRLKVSTYAHLNLSGKVRLLDVKASTHGVFGDHSAGFSAEELWAHASTRATLYIPSSTQGDVKCSTGAHCYVDSSYKGRIKNSGGTIHKS